MPDINEKTYQVLELISRDKELSQRDLATRSGLSLGMVNLLLKRLIQTGYIKSAALNRKKMSYLLTPKGLSEKTSRSYQYLQRSIRTFQEARFRIENMIKKMISEGHRNFVILGEGEIADVVDVILSGYRSSGLIFRRSKEGNPPFETHEVVLDCRWGRKDGAVGVSVLEEILKS
ncbi:MAG TPA: winged helix-turn-helix transcriptional regulator [Elusimicrobiota bacterium]|nr:winged helix-turn-helix transcriptional regulator [Elusimicrobiota bacterium]